MKWWTRAIIILLAAAIVGAMVFFVVVIANGKLTTDYKAYVSLAFYAAGMSDGVRLQDDFGEYQLDEDACRKLNYYVTRNPVATLKRGGEEHITLLIGDDVMTVSVLDEDSAVVTFSVMERTYRMRVYQRGMWAGIRSCTSGAGFSG